MTSKKVITNVLKSKKCNEWNMGKVIQYIMYYDIRSLLSNAWDINLINYIWIT